MVGGLVVGGRWAVEHLFVGRLSVVGRWWVGGGPVGGSVVGCRWSVACRSSVVL